MDVARRTGLQVVVLLKQAEYASGVFPVFTKLADYQQQSLPALHLNQLFWSAPAASGTTTMASTNNKLPLLPQSANGPA